MITIFFVDKIIDEKRVYASAMMNDAVKGLFYLPPLNRTNTSNIKVNTRFLGTLDEVTGYGALLVALDDDFDGRFDYKLTVNADIKATGNVNALGDVTAGAISLKTHYHVISTMTGQDAALVAASAVSLQPVAFTSFMTAIPS